MNRTSTAIWKGPLVEGSGIVGVQSKSFPDQPYSFKGRFEDETGKSGTNPEELIAAAHASCFAMQLSHFLAENGTPANELNAKAVLSYGSAAGGGFEITESQLILTARISNIDEKKFLELAEQAKLNCPVSKALGAIKISLSATLA